jgi:hypothetical protein
MTRGSITAVCRGAVLKARSLTIDPALNTALDERMHPTPSVVSRIPRLSYGVSFFETFDPGKHNEQDIRFYVLSQQNVVSELMHWYVRIVSRARQERPASHRVANARNLKGIDVLEAEKPAYTFIRSFLSCPPGNQFSVTIWKCLSTDPPESKRDRSDVVRCSDVICSIDMPFDDLPLCADQEHREILFELDLDVSRFPMLQFVAKLNGQVRGRRELKMEYP